MSESPDRRSISVAHERLQLLLYIYRNNQKVLAQKLRVSEGLISSAKDNKAFSPRKRIQDAIDVLYDREAVLWSQDLESLGRQLDRIFAKLDGLTSPEDDEHRDLWLSVVALVRLASDDWTAIVKDERTQILTRLFFGRTVDYVLTKFAHGLVHIPDAFGRLTRLSREQAVSDAADVGDYMMDLLSRKGIEQIVLEEAKAYCGSPRIAFQVLRAKTRLSKLVRHYYSPDLSGEIFQSAIEAGFLADCLEMSKIHPGDPAWPNIRWQVATRAARWQSAANLAAFISKPAFADVLLHGMFDVEPIVSDVAAWPGLAAVLAFPENPALANLVHRLNYAADRSEQFATMVLALDEMKKVILQGPSTYASVMAVLPSTQQAGEKK